MTQALEYAEVRVPFSLTQHVRAIWRLRGRATSDAPQPIVPDGCVEIVLNLGDPALEHRNGRATAQPNYVIAGQMFAPTIVTPTGAIDMWGIRLQPGAASALIGVPGSELSERTYSAAELSSRFGAALASVGERTPAQREGAIVQMLTHAAGKAGRLSREIGALVDYALESRGDLSVRAMSAWSGWSMRRVQRVFAQHVGFGPKLLMRLGRFQHALAMSRQEPRRSWADIAARCRYYDQSHLVRDSRQFAGCSPTELFAETPGMTEIFIAK
ncbi:MAG: helix-turn-helix domain-containing protein [Gemmatimonadaceae bacterium]